MKRWQRWLRRGTIGAVATPVALALAGMSYQALATRADRRHFPPPGKLVNVFGHRLHIQCSGAGRPTVVLETGALAMSALWGGIQPQVAVHTRVCSYDRAGLGWSEPGPEPRDALQICRELRTLLGNADKGPPYVLVGHSFGGLLVRVYADQYPEDVVGLLLLDPSHPSTRSLALSSRSSHRLLAGSTHASLATGRASAAQVAEAIRELIDATRTRADQKRRPAVERGAAADGALL